MVGDESSTHLVRLFADYAETVIWFAPGPVPYEDTKLSARLQHRLEEWERSFYLGQAASEYRWRDPADARRFAAEGRRLAEQLADELGKDFEVVYPDGAGRAQSVRSDFPPTNPAAAAAFHQMALDYPEVVEDPDAPRFDRGTLTAGSPGKRVPSRRRGTRAARSGDAGSFRGP